jgi:G3E family GTPase
LTVNKDGQQVEEWLELDNGCICCSVKYYKVESQVTSSLSNPLNRDQGVNAIESLMERKGAFDYILLETTGLADPGNIAPLFWVDEGLGSSIYLDGIVTLVDAKNILHSLDEPAPDAVQHLEDAHPGPELTTAHLQISHADIIVLNKSDQVTPLKLQEVRERIRAINSLAKIHVTSHSQVPQLEGVVLDLHAYDSVQTEDLDFAAKGHSHLDPSISTISLSLPVLNPSRLERLDSWLQSVLWESKLPLFEGSATTEGLNFEIHRMKGRVSAEDGSIKLLQGVREVFEILDARESGRESRSTEASSGKLVLIGRGLRDEPFRQSISRYLGADG